MANEAAINGMFGRIAGIYDLLNRLLSMGIDQRWRNILAENARMGTRRLILDLAAGTLDVAIKIAKKWPQTRVCAIDFCRPMLQKGLGKPLGGRIAPCVGDVKALPIGENAADCVTIAFGIRNITPRSAAFAEMLRVLEPGGKALVLEFGSGSERIWGGIYNFYLSQILPLIGKAISRDKGAYEYLARTVREFPSADVLAEEMGNAGFVNVAYKKLTGGIVCLHWGFKPQI